MTKRLLFALLASVALALPSAAQDSKTDRTPDSAAAPKGAPADGEAPAQAPKDAADSMKYYLPLDKGGAVMFKKGEISEKAAKKKLRYKGYSKKGAAAYKEAGKAHLDPEAVKSLDSAGKAKAEGLAAEAAMADDADEAIKVKLAAANEKEAPKAADGAASEKEKLEAAKEMMPVMRKDIAKKMADFERDSAGGKKVFKMPDADSAPSVGAPPAGPK